jgi:alkaline phosphatase
VEFAEKRGDTLVVSVADHECGGFTVGANGTYDFKYDDIKKVKKTIGGILREITADLENGKETFRKYIELDVTDEEIDVVLAANPSNGDLARELKQLLSRKIIVGWSTSGHTAGDVVRYAFGPGSQSLIGKMHHAEMGRKLQDMLGLREKVDAITAAARAKAPESQPSGD